ncbi:MAG: response regulator transcription factor [Proteobacteria bacterium]|nr:response regulator transcription factor [Pseudomonadota bacterium]MBU4471295.1 response regulator transcription factor [Pseudomonadota bacterium]MCG2751700.1 response regulator transcription factor [Desulfobacteraceae bacterium]
MQTSMAIGNRPLVFICGPCPGSGEVTADTLQAKDFEVRFIPESRKAMDEIISCAPDVVLLDTELPGHGGYEVCRQIRSDYNGHIIVLGHHPDEASQLLAFERGADDYITWPVSQAVLVARITVLLNRRYGLQNKADGLKIIAGELVVDASRREVFLGERKIDLTAIQFDILWYLINRAGRVVSREELYEALHKGEYKEYDRSVDVYVSRIRRMLGDDFENPIYLKTVRGSGYLFVGG